MPDPNDKRRPHEGAALETPTKKSTDQYTPSGYRPCVNLTRLTLRDREVWDEAYLSGYLAGHEAGWKAADDHAAALYAEAARIVRTMAGLPERDPEADRAAAIRRADRFGQRAVLSSGAP